MEKKEIQDTQTYLAEQIMNLEEYYSIEDYGNLLTIQSIQTRTVLDLLRSKANLNKNNEITITTIRAL